MGAVNALDAGRVEHGKVEEGTPSRRRGLLAVASVGVVNTAIWALGRAGGVEFAVEQGGSETSVTLAQVVTASVLPVALGLVVVGVVAARSARWSRALVVAGVVAAVVSVGMPLSAASDGVAGALLAVMHLVVGAGLVAGAAASDGRLGTARSVRA